MITRQYLSHILDPKFPRPGATLPRRRSFLSRFFTIDRAKAAAFAKNYPRQAKCISLLISGIFRLFWVVAWALVLAASLASTGFLFRVAWDSFRIGWVAGRIPL